jgi:hypothetical protein
VKFVTHTETGYERQLSLYFRFGHVSICINSISYFLCPPFCVIFFFISTFHSFFLFLSYSHPFIKSCFVVISSYIPIYWFELVCVLCCICSCSFPLPSYFLILHFACLRLLVLGICILSLFSAYSIIEPTPVIQIDITFPFPILLSCNRFFPTCFSFFICY